MLPRVLEPEVMDTEEEAAEYDAMDHAAVNERFVDDLLAVAPDARRVLDVGTGTARIPIALCRKHPSCTVVATDLAKHMLSIARANVLRAGLAHRIELACVDAKGSHLPRAAFDVVMSNSIVHHIPDPRRAFGEMVGLLAPCGVLFVRDLERPESEQRLAELVERWASNETPKARRLFEASLRAALTLDEVVAMVRPFGIPASAVARTSDRHWTVAFRDEGLRTL